MEISQEVLDDLRVVFAPAILRHLRAKGLKVPRGAIVNIVVRDPAKISVADIPAWRFFGDSSLKLNGCKVFSQTIARGVHAVVRGFANGSSQTVTVRSVCEHPDFTASNLQRHGLGVDHLAELSRMMAEHNLGTLQE